jgi:hypothetical protein
LLLLLVTVVVNIRGKIEVAVAEKAAAEALTELERVKWAISETKRLADATNLETIYQEHEKRALTYAMLPRRLGPSNWNNRRLPPSIPEFENLREFQDVSIHILTIPDFEAARLGNDLGKILKWFGLNSSISEEKSWIDNAEIPTVFWLFRLGLIPTRLALREIG